MNERTTGCHPADRDRPVAEAVEPRLGPIQGVRRHVQPASAPLDEWPAAVVADPPAGDRAEDVAERAGGGHCDVRPGLGLDRLPEQHDALSGERARRDGPGVDHHELAGGGQHGVHEHQDEHRVDPVVADHLGERVRDRAEDGGRRHDPEV